MDEEEVRRRQVRFVGHLQRPARPRADEGESGVPETEAGRSAVRGIHEAPCRSAVTSRPRRRSRGTWAVKGTSPNRSCCRVRPGEWPGGWVQHGGPGNSRRDNMPMNRRELLTASVAGAAILK